MGTVTIRQLRNHGGDVVERVARGESITITRAGSPVAELRPLTAPGLSARTLLERRRHLPPVDPWALRREIDSLMAPDL